MKNKNKNILVIVKNEIQYAEIKTGRTPSVEVKQSLRIKKPEDVNEKIQEICKKHKFKSVSILVSDELIYILKLDLDYSIDKDGDLRNVISERLEKSIPEHISDIIWDYKVISHIDRHYSVEVAAMRRDLYDKIHGTLDKFGIKIRHIKPFSVAISRVINTNQFALIMYFSSIENVITLIKNNYVYFAASVYDVNDKKYILDLLKYLRDKYNLSENTICIYSGNSKMLKPIDISNYKVRKLMIEVAPYIGLLRYDESVKENDFSLDLEHGNRRQKKSFFDNILSLFNNDRTDVTSNSQSASKNKKTSNNNSLKILIPVLIIMLIIAGVFMYKYITDNSTVRSRQTPVSNQQLGQKDSIESNNNVVTDGSKEISNAKPIDTVNSDIDDNKTVKEQDKYSKYVIRVLNGTKSKENSDEIVSLISQIGNKIEKIDVGEAYVKNYNDTIIYAKPSIEKEYIDSIKKSIMADYSDNVKISPEPLKDSYSYDIEIIVGTK